MKTKSCLTKNQPSTSKMSTTLCPTPAHVVSIRSSIQGYVSGNLPTAMKPNMVAPLLTAVNQWSTQIPVLLESVSSINQVFDIRSDLFTAPRFLTNVFNIPFGDLPPPFHEFMTFISKLIEAQKVNREKAPPKASHVSFIIRSARSVNDKKSHFSAC